MAAASYTTDLVDWIADNDTAAWTELTNATAGGAPDEVDTESALQGTNTVSQITNTVDLCSLIRILASPVDLTGKVALVWHGHGVATALESYANNGLRVAFATAVGNWKSYTVSGGDVPPFPYGKWINSAVDPSLTPDATNGTAPGVSVNGIGSMCELTQVVARGQPHICDIIRTGRAEARMNGGDLANGYATFGGFAAVNDTQTNRWGLIQTTTGGYQWKGLMVLGHNSAVDFRDSNTNIFVQDCRKVSSTFNKIEIRQATSRVDWTNISILNSSPSTNASKGDLQVVDNADVNIDSCTFTDMGTFAFLSNSTVLNSTFRRCGQVTLGGATIDNCIFDRSTAATALLAGSATATLSDCAFTSDGTGHAIELTAAGTYTFSGLTFSGYAGSNGSTGNEAVYVNVASGSVTINVSGGDVPTYRTAGATVTVVASATVTLTGLQSGSEVRAYLGSDPSTATEIDGVESSGTSFTFSQSSAGQTGYIVIFAIGFKDLLLPITYSGSNVSIPIQQVVDRVYSNP